MTIRGDIYRVRALEFAEWGILQSWVKQHADDPVTTALAQLEKARRKGINVVESEGALLKSARDDARRWPPEVMTARWFALVADTPGGTTEFLGMMLDRLGPALPAERLAAIEATMDRGEVDALLLASIGRDPYPKAAGPAAA